MIDGEERTDTSPRTALIERYTPIEGRTFIDLGAGDGYEGRALAHRGAAHVLAAEGKQSQYRHALAAQEHLGLANHEARVLDVRRIDEYDLPPFDVVLCFGLLYHMTNPFNVLKRIRAITGGLLLLDTHVAPLSLHGIRNSHAASLPWRLHALELDGVRFDGRMVRHVGEPTKSKGGLDNPWSFWLTTGSLVEAVSRAGFRIEEFYSEADDQSPAELRAAHAALPYGRWNARVWLVATPVAEAPTPGEPRERIIEPIPEPLARAALARVAGSLPSGWKQLLPLSLKKRLRRIYAR